MADITITGAGDRKIHVPTGLFINNKFVPATSSETLTTLNPTTNTPLGEVSAAQPADVDAAVSAAQEALKTWKTSHAERRKLLNKLADLIERDAQDFASLEAVDGGILFNMSLGFCVVQAVETIRYFAGWADKVDGQAMDFDQGLAYTKREPIGVCAAVVPWNTPLMITAWKLAPALAVGNTLILKTPELTPLYGQKLAQLILEAGFPAGVVSILPGLGHTAGQALADHPQVRKLSFTGSLAVGRQILVSAAKSNLKRVTLELGGKGPSIVFNDCNFENALAFATAGITLHNGQICATGSRIYVQEDIYDKFISEFTARTKEAVAGDPLLPETAKGPIISATQKERIMDYIAKAKNEGTELLHGASEEQGNFVPNTAFINVSPNDTIMREEVFGPVASIAKFKTEEEVIALANDNEYGLAAALFTNDISRAVRVSDQIEAGMVTVNTWGSISANAPFGGIKQSGFGRENGIDALGDWTQVKCVKINVFKQ
ncbi:aldehyde dehydrogenase domain-containing protein [Fusarium flagelliforme]|uniref:aldehyde dehydrogenase domain-containing protein n=1 Tax=Fusarium flagelliforme TaxID=2675880 RepID=UPI001E8CD9B9|nr:aldehyde dehydrogenase domain-containing protein [Fusarium flagelliforme]KAH7191808.1 aldehyde dehydrogenase domain-containing protein [Fusarium flagelliforme]